MANQEYTLQDRQYDDLLYEADRYNLQIRGIDKKIAELQIERERTMKKATTAIQDLIRLKSIKSQK